MGALTCPGCETRFRAPSVSGFLSGFRAARDMRPLDRRRLLTLDDDDAAGTSPDVLARLAQRAREREAQRDRLLRQEGTELLAEYAADGRTMADACRLFRRGAAGMTTSARVAWHESGHACAQVILLGDDSLDAVSIRPRQGARRHHAARIGDTNSRLS